MLCRTRDICIVSLHCEFCCEYKVVVDRLLQTLHSNGFSPEWIRLWTLNAALLWQHVPHSVHLYLPVSVFLWATKWSLVLYRLSHTVHKCGLDLSSRGCSVISLLSASVFTSISLPVYVLLTMHMIFQTTVSYCCV